MVSLVYSAPLCEVINICVESSFLIGTTSSKSSSIGSVTLGGSNHVEDGGDL